MPAMTQAYCNVDLASVERGALHVGTLGAAIEPVKQNDDEGAHDGQQPDDARLKHALSRRRSLGPESDDRGHRVHRYQQYGEDGKSGLHDYLGR